MAPHNQFKDFILFLYVHMALCDGSLHESEETVILNKMGKIFPDVSNLSAKLNAAVAEYKSTDPALIDAFIKDSFKHFDQVKFAQKYKIYTDMYEVVNADGRIDGTELTALNNLKAIIDMDAEVRHM
ncbi:MAG: TerB family tellurite resistance protein [Bacteroidetes bacterium]|nr:TerB family tellurite resistance protein [Bacteroidota bacterium]